MFRRTINYIRNFSQRRFCSTSPPKKSLEFFYKNKSDLDNINSIICGICGYSVVAYEYPYDKDLTTLGNILYLHFFAGINCIFFTFLGYIASPFGIIMLPGAYLICKYKQMQYEKEEEQRR